MKLAHFVRRHEQAVIVTWLAACAVLLGVVSVFGLRMGGAERAIDAWNARWFWRVSYGQELYESERYEEAATYLARLDRDFPARWSRHRWDWMRERQIALLGLTYAELGRKKLCLQTFDRLVEFDSLNWTNHFLLAEHCQRFGESERAEEAYRGVLAIHPSHLPSVEALIGAKYDAGSFPEVTSLFETYLDGWLLGDMTLSLGQVEVEMEVPIDGRPHIIEVPVEIGAGWSGELALATHGYSVHLSSIELIGPLRVGVAEPRSSVILRGDTARGGSDVELVGPATWSARGPEAVLHLDANGSDVARVRVTLTAFKACPLELHEMLTKSYANQLADDAWSSVSERTVVGGCIDAGSHFQDLDFLHRAAPPHDPVP